MVSVKQIKQFIMGHHKLRRWIILPPIVCLYILAMVFVGIRSTHPSDGTRLGLRESDRVDGSISIVILSDHGLFANDQVIAVEGKSIEHWVEDALDFNTTTPNWHFRSTLTYTVIRDERMMQIPVELNRYPFAVIFEENLGVVIFLMIMQFSAFWIYIQRPEKTAAQILLLAASAMVTFSICWFFGMDVVSFISIKGLWLYYRIATFIMIMTFCSAMLHFGLLLPVPSTHLPRLLPMVYLAPYPVYGIFLAISYIDNTLDWLRSTEVGVQAIAFFYLLIALIILISDYRKTQNPVTRKALRAVAFTCFVGGFPAVLLGLLPSMINGHPLFGWNLLPLFALPVVIGMAVAVIFYQLLNIRIVIQRTMVWGALTMLVIIVYSLVVGMLGVLFHNMDTPLLIGLVGTGLVAVIFQPVRERLQYAVTEWLYGERDNPYGVVSRLGARLEAAIAPDTVLYTIVETVAQALKLPYAAIELKQGDEFVKVASYGSPTDNPAYFPLSDANETIGYLVVAPRSLHETFDAADRNLLKDLTRQAYVAVTTVRLTNDLQLSRERLIVAREEERRRVRRDLHDGIGPALASIPLQLDAARNLLKRDTSAADDLLTKLKGQIQTLITDIRRLVYELNPPMLDEFGLLSTLQAQIDQLNQINGLRIMLDVPESLPQLHAAVEIAAYRITMEAVTNVLRHARAKTCCVCLGVNDELKLVVTDDGCGFSPDYKRGVGLESMKERALELGGTFKVDTHPNTGTTITVCLPITKKV